MRLFEMFTPILQEDEASDQAERQIGAGVFRLIGEFLRTEDWREFMVPCMTQTEQPGALALQSKSVLAPPYDDFWLVFEPRAKGVSAVATRLHDGGSMISLPILDRPGDASTLADRWFSDGETRDLFIHEFTHYRLLHRDQPSRDATDVKRMAQSRATGREPKLSKRGSEGGDSEYFNHPQETNAFYQEATTRVLANLSRWPDDTRKRLAKLPVPDMVKSLRTLFPPEFVEHLNPENRRKLDLRLARFAQQTLRPALVFNDSP